MKMAKSETENARDWTKEEASDDLLPDEVKKELKIPKLEDQAKKEKG